MITHDQADLAKQIVATFDDSTQKEFTDKYHALESDARREDTITKLIDKYGDRVQQNQPPAEPPVNAGDIAGSVGKALDPRALMAAGNQNSVIGQNPMANAIMNSASEKLQSMAMNSNVVKTGLAAYSPKQLVPSNNDPQGAWQKFTAPVYNAAAALTSQRGALTAGMSTITDARQLAALGAGSESVNNSAGKAFEDFTSNVKAPKFVSDIRAGLNATDPKNIEAFHKKTLTALDDAFHNEGTKFDSFIQRTSEKNSENPVDLTNAVQDIISNKGDFTRLGSIVKRVPELNDLVAAVENGENPNLKMTLAESQDLYKKIGAKISGNKLAGNNLNFEDYNILKYLRNSLREAQVESLPEDLTKDFADVRKQYGQAADDYKLLRKQIKDPVTFENSIKSHLSGSDILKNKAQRLAPDVAGDIKNAALASKVKSGAKKAVGATALAVGVPGSAYLAWKHFNP